MRVIIKNQTDSTVVFVWKDDDCKMCKCKQGNCGLCDRGWLPQDGKYPLQKAPFILNLPAERYGINGGEYQYFAHGSFNLVYQSKDGKRVLKISIDESEITDLPERAARVWNTINPGFPAEVIRVVKNGKPVAWVAPFIRGGKPTHAEIAQKVLEIYENTGRIVADAFVTSNFVKTEDGSIVCIDVGAAFFLESRPRFERSHSQASLKTWWGGERGKNSAMSCIYRHTFTAEKKTYEVIVNTIKALLYLQMHRPDFRRVSVMRSNKDLINLLALGYDKNAETLGQIIDGLDRFLAGEAVPDTALSSNALAAAALSSSAPASNDNYSWSSENGSEDCAVEDEAMQLGNGVPQQVAFLGQHPPGYSQSHPGFFAYPTTVSVQASHTGQPLPSLNNI